MSDKANRSVLKLQVTAAALDRLIGGDTEFELELRQQIVQKFAEKHLKGVLSEKVLKEFNEIWNKGLDASIREIGQELFEKSVNGVGGSLSSGQEKAGWDFKALVRDSLMSLIRGTFHKEMDQYLERQKRAIEAEVRQKLTQEIKDQVAAAIRDGVRNTLAELSKGLITLDRSKA